jgi:HAD superfamily phosphoserine phosphatase-like hydrolase
MADILKKYIFASDFDQTLTFNDSGYVLAELVGIPIEEFARKSKGMAKINLVQQGAELAYLLLHDPEFRQKVRKEHLREVGKRIRLKSDIKLLYQLLDTGIDGHQFDFYVLSAAPVEIVRSALEDIVPPDHIYGTEFRYKSSGEIDTIIRATAGYGKVAVLDKLLVEKVAGPDHVVYTGDGSSDIHVMLHINARDGLTIAVSEAPNVSQVAKRTVLSTSALAVLAPILEEIAGWERYRIRSLFEANHMLIQEWERVRTDWLTVRPAAQFTPEEGVKTEAKLESARTSHQHQRALALCVRIERASPIPQNDLGAWQAEVAHLVQSEIAVHFAAEEEIVFPAAEKFEELRALVRQLISEHANLRTMFANAQEDSLSSNEILVLARSLSTHIRTEERQLFERMQQLLSIEELGILGSKLQSALKDSEEACRLPSATTRLRPLK